MSATPHYAIVVGWSEEDQLWLARVPDLEGCVTHGHTREEAFANALEAMAGWLAVAHTRGDPIPEPRRHLAAIAA